MIVVEFGFQIQGSRLNPSFCFCVYLEVSIIKFIFKSVPAEGSFEVSDVDGLIFNAIVMLSKFLLPGLCETSANDTEL